MAGRPELLDDVHDVDGVDRAGEVASDVAVEVGVAVGHELELDEQPRLRGEAALVRLAQRDPSAAAKP
jgi:hypothetical protein